MKALPERYARRVPLDLRAPCWPWTGTRDRLGYGRIMIARKAVLVHRVAYQLHVGEIPRGWELDHVCHSHAVAGSRCRGGVCEHRGCWNPAHLELVSSAENSRRGNHPLFALSRANRCRRGHDLRDKNIVRIEEREDGSLRRRCRLCAAANQRTWRARSR
jgi:hypothetical protein